MELRSIKLPTEIWQRFERLAELAGATASRGRSTGETSWRVLLRRIGEDPELLERLAKYFAAGPLRSNASFGETIIRPVQPVCETIARISVTGQTVAVRFPEKRDDFREVVKAYGCQWESPRWERVLDNLAGEPADRAAELGHRLLAVGFCVVLPSLTIQQMAISGSYEPECRRWILAGTGGQYKNHFILSEASAGLDECDYDGLCCADSVDSLKSYIEGWPLDGFEVVIFEGKWTADLYDGVVARPVCEIKRMSAVEFLSDESLYDLESID